MLRLRRRALQIVVIAVVAFAMLGALIGRPVVNHLNQRMFELTALGLTFGAALLMFR